MFALTFGKQVSSVHMSVLSPVGELLHACISADRNRYDGTLEGYIGKLLITSFKHVLGSQRLCRVSVFEFCMIALAWYARTVNANHGMQCTSASTRKFAVVTKANWQ